MTIPHVAPRGNDGRLAEMGGLLMLWMVPVVGFLMALLGLGH